MIFSLNQLFSDHQAVVADAASTNILDLGAPGTPYGAAAALVRDVGPGEPVPIEVMITQAFDNLTSLDIQLQVATDEAFTTPVIVQSQSLLLAALTVGARVNFMYLPENTDLRYLRLFYDVTGTAPTAGTIYAGISGGRQTNQ